MDRTDTIYALSSGSTPSGVAVVRISGASTADVLREMCGSPPPPRRAELRSVRASDGELIDRALVLFFPAPRSVTGEDCGEIHVHGGGAVVAALLDAVGAFPGCRMAHAGEFSRRGFLNGKMDLPGAEALADLIAAETHAQRRLAVANADGRQGKLYQEWRNRLMHLRAAVEANLDFSDQPDVYETDTDAPLAAVGSLCEEIETHLLGFKSAEIVRNGLRVVIAGMPNAGKSSLLNCLSRREAAIVADEAGTTRDPIEVALDLNGYKVWLTDTAGMREAAVGVERIGIERAAAAAQAADLVIWLHDLSRPAFSPRRLGPAPHIYVGTKYDLRQSRETSIGGLDFKVSTTDGTGIDDLLGEIAAVAGKLAGNIGDVAPSRRRHRELLEKCAYHLERVRQEDLLPELRAEELRLASDQLGGIGGEVGTEDLLGAIFSEFCIGK